MLVTSTCLSQKSQFVGEGTDMPLHLSEKAKISEVLRSKAML